MSSSYNRKDHLYQQAKDEGYRSRAAFKLIELQKRFRVLSKGHSVLDLGAWPGGWLQVASEVVSGSGICVGVDLAQIEPLGLSNVETICGDFNSEEVAAQINSFCPKGYNAVISDASPKLTGIQAADQAMTAECAKNTFELAQKFLRKGGNYVCKIFKGSETDKFVKSIKSKFNQFSRVELDATRNSSSETYIVARGFLGQ
jgi:23S rRNA (uridine2552-2'-O)-methyltransferase